MAADPSGHVVITWDSFRGSSETQQFSESTTGCAGFRSPQTITSGVFLNGTPAIDTDGNVWSSRNEFTSRSIRNIISKKTGSGWVDTPVESYSYPSASFYEMFADFDEREESRPDAPDPGEGPNLTRGWFYQNHGIIPRAAANGTYTGEYSPILAASPDGGLAIVTLSTESTNSHYGDVTFYRYKGGSLSSGHVLNRDGGNNPQMEPWVVCDQDGGIHTTWYDGREGEWRLYGASSIDDGASWTEYSVGDSTFRKGFDENTSADYYAWVGHFQALVTTASHVVAVFGDSHTSNTSRIYAARSHSR